MLTLVPLQDSDCAATETPWYAATSWLYLQFLPRMEVDDTWPENILWTDETHFTLGGAVNTENCRIWGSTKPLVLHQRPLHSATVWCGFTSTFILGRVFFERIAPRGRVRCTVTSASYENILMQRVIPAWQKGLHQGDLSDVPWRLQVTKTFLCSVWSLPCKNVNVLTPMFEYRMGHHSISVAKFNVCFVKPSQMNALFPEVVQILGPQDLLTLIHVASGCGDTWRIVATKDMFDLWLIGR